jgi:hypothetical protein
MKNLILITTLILFNTIAIIYYSNTKEIVPITFPIVLSLSWVFIINKISID